MKKKLDLNWLELLVGILFILIGIYTFRNPGSTLNGFVIIYGILAVISGVADIAFYVQLERHTGFGPTVSLLSGILNILLGIFLVIKKEVGAFAATILFPIWFIAHCLGKLMNANAVRLYRGKVQYWVTLIFNILGIILGFLLIFNPFASAISMVYIAGFYLILMGIESIISAFNG